MLFEEYKLGHLVLRNRIVMPAINLGYSVAGEVCQRHIDFYSARSQGGAGLIMVGGTAIEETGTVGGFLSLHSDSLIAGHKALTSAVKQDGARIGVQLFQAGRYSAAFKVGQDIMAPSAIPSVLTKHVPRALSTDEVYEVIAAFGNAAKRAQDAGYDLVEVIMSAGYLVSQFLSPLTNQRTDEFGGSFPNRMRFGVEIIKDIRQKVGNDFPIGVRLGGNDFIPGGNTSEEMSLFARELEQASVNLINVTGGWHESPVPQIQSEVPNGTYVYLAARVKKAVKIPVIASNRITTPEMAEQILQNKQADLISVARGFLADADWAKKAVQGQSQCIRKCIGCMNCLDTLFNGKGLICAINPACGREAVSNIETASLPQNILVIGAGPAGLEAARVAALKGHHVTIWEKSTSIGGQWNIASIPPGKKAFSTLTDFYENSLKQLGVTILLGQEASSKKLGETSFDRIVVATGARPLMPPIPITGKPNLVNAWDVLNGQDIIGTNIIVVGGGSVGCETALHLAEKGTLDAESLRFLMLHQAEPPELLYKLLTQGSYRVQLIEMGSKFAGDMIASTRWTVIKHMVTLGIEMRSDTRVTAIEDDQVRIVSKEGKEDSLQADTIVIAAGAEANNKLYNELREKFQNVHLVGDANHPAKVADAIHLAFKLANTF